MTSQNKKARYKTMTTKETTELLKTLSLQQKKELLSLLLSMSSLDDKVKAIEKELNIKLKD
jgi:uncharacterized tellurite resistance protein B-like protein